MTLKAGAEVKQFVVWANGDREFYSREDAEIFVAQRSAELISEGFDALVEGLKIREENCGFAVESGYSDAYPFEILRIVSPKCIEIRALKAELINGGDLEFHVGGFAAHCSNQRAQKYKYTRNERASKFKIRLNKRGKWAYKNRRFWLSEEPYKFHDFNF